MKKIISLIIALSLILSLNIDIFSSASTDGTTLLKVAPGTSDETTYTITSVTGTASKASNAVVLTVSNGAQGKYSIVPSTAITINKRNLVFKYKIKYESTSSTPLTYIRLRIYGSGITLYDGDLQPSTEYAIKSTPVSGVWYEGEIRLDKMQVGESNRLYDVGDKITSIQVDARNNSGINYTCTLEYLEIVEPDGEDDSYPVYRPEDKNKSLIDAKNTEISNAEAGKTIYIEDGEYSNVRLIVPSGVKGTAVNPIIIRPQTIGGAVFKGRSTISVSGQYVIIEGFYFTDGMASTAISFTSSSSYCTLRNCAVIDYNGINSDTLSFETGEKYPEVNHRWVGISGNNITVENCYFREKYGTGVMFEVSLGKTEDGVEYGRNVTVKNNYFGYYHKGGINGTETLRIGLSGVSLEDANCLVTGNFFERCNGEDELISSKSSTNTYSYNTFYNSKGALTLRHGDNCTVTGNLFIGIPGASSSTLGVRVIGKKNKIYNNYFYGMPYDSRAVAIEAGVTNAGTADYPLLLNSYSPVEELDMHNNTFVDVGVGISIGTSYNGLSGTYVRNESPEGKVYNNVIYSTKKVHPAVDLAGAASQLLTLENNLYYGKDIDTDLSDEAGLINKMPSFIVDESLLYESIDGLGADISEVKKAPLSPYEVIPDWVNKMYEKGELTFETVEHDIINNKDYENTLADMLVLGKDCSYAFKNGVKTVIDSNDEDVTLIYENGRILIPLRFVAEALGVTVLWNDDTKEITLKSTILSDKERRGLDYVSVLKTGSKEVKIAAVTDSAEEYVNKTITLDKMVELRNGRAYIPLRAFEEATGIRVFSDDTGIAVITPSLNIIKRISSDDEFIEDCITKTIMADYVISGLTAEYSFEDNNDTDYTNDVESVILSWETVERADGYLITVMADDTVINTVYTENNSYTHIFNNSIPSATKAVNYGVQAVADGNKSAMKNASVGYLFADGDGSDTAPYKIYNYRHYMNLLNGADLYADKHFIQCADIYNPVTEVIDNFSGSYKGETTEEITHRIITLNINSSDKALVGMFGFLSGTVENIRVRGSITATTSDAEPINDLTGIGAVAGGSNTETTSIINCINEAYIKQTASSLGGSYPGVAGIIGVAYNSEMIINNCINAGKIESSASNAGGISGYSSALISECANFGDISAVGSAGGIVGYSYSEGVSKCYNSGNIKTTSNSGGTGGIVGFLFTTTASECYNEGESINGQRYSGGIVGKAQPSKDGNSFIDNCVNVSGGITVTHSTSATAGGIVGGFTRGNILSIANSINYGLLHNVVDTGIAEDNSNKDNKVYLKYVDPANITEYKSNPDTCYFYNINGVTVDASQGTGLTEAQLKTLLSTDTSFDGNMWEYDVTTGFPTLKFVSEFKILNTKYNLQINTVN